MRASQKSDDATLPPAPEDDDGDGGAANAPFDDASPNGDDGGLAHPAPVGPPFDAGEGGICTRPLAMGDLIIVELMIESTSGTGDHGEWIEVESSLRCAVNINGLAECPTGAKVNTFEVSGDLWIPPLGTFIIADSTNPAVNGHHLPGS